MKTEIKSPLTFSTNVIEIGRLNSGEIIEIYLKHFNMNVEKYFRGTPEVKILRCLDTNYMFYYPFSAQGDEDYYASMGKFDWYYHPMRWEHSKVLNLIHKTDRLLEVGSGSGFFLNELKKLGFEDFSGLELNGRAIEEARQSGIFLQKEKIDEYSKQNENKYDVVCSFQVLEHISEPYDFLHSQIKCLKSKGRLIVAVPNNDSYMKNNVLYNKVLNMPPHHMGLWTLLSFRSLEKIFPVTFKEVYYEPMIGANVDVYLWNRVNRFFFGFSIFNRIIWKLSLHEVLRYFVNKNSKKMRGESMLLVFEKN